VPLSLEGAGHGAQSQREDGQGEVSRFVLMRRTFTDRIVAWRKGRRRKGSAFDLDHTKVTVVPCGTAPRQAVEPVEEVIQ